MRSKRRPSRRAKGTNKYSAFGRVVEGIEVVDAITQLEIDTYGRYGSVDRPYPKQAIIETIRIERAAVGVAWN